jgi:hypothetical protein
MGEACRTHPRDKKYIYNYDHKRGREERNRTEGTGIMLGHVKL